MRTRSAESLFGGLPKCRQHEQEQTELTVKIDASSPSAEQAEAQTQGIDKFLWLRTTETELSAEVVLIHRAD